MAVKIVIAPDSFKGSLSAPEVTTFIRRAFEDVAPDIEIIEVPMADGGEGSLAALVQATSGRTVEVTVHGPLMQPVRASYGILGDGKTVVIEMALAAGLTLAPVPHRNPLSTSTYGVGELFRAALDAGYRDFIVAVGGSATNDGGLGFLQALGAQFLDADGSNVRAVGGALSSIQQVNLDGLDSRLAECQIVTASDVDNPLCGSRGASFIFGPQKGATPDMVQFLDEGLRHYANLVETALGRSHKESAGAGAAGGLGFALLCINAQFASGARLVAQKVQLSEKLVGADFVITGEGKTDEGTLYGKVPFVVAQLARERNAKAILLSGSLGEIDNDKKQHLDEVFLSMHSILPRPMTTEAAMNDAPTLLYDAARNIARLIALLPMKDST